MPWPLQGLCGPLCDRMYFIVRLMDITTIIFLCFPTTKDTILNLYMGIRKGLFYQKKIPNSIRPSQRKKGFFRGVAGRKQIFFKGCFLLPPPPFFCYVIQTPDPFFFKSLNSMVSLCSKDAANSTAQPCSSYCSICLFVLWA